MTSFAVYSLGCKVNTYESESYYQALIEAGFVGVSFKAKADIYIINSCALTENAVNTSCKIINRAKRLNPRAFICVVGCLVASGDKKLKQIGAIDLLIGSSHKQDLARLIIENYQKPHRSPIATPLAIDGFEELKVSKFRQTRAFLKIQDGCSQHCSYCIIPLLRGPERSLEPALVLDYAQQLTEHHQEIVLTGIHTGRYGKEYQLSLGDLLVKLLELPKLSRLRLSSIEINEVSEEIQLLIAQNDKMAKHLHIPLQSGSDSILKAMRRPYDSEGYYQSLMEIRRRIPNISISSDIMVGFPGESQQDWSSSYDFIKKCNFSFLHIFPYSVRMKTPAAQYPGFISPTIKKQRVRELLAYSQSQYHRYQESFLGKTLVVLVEKSGDGFSFGHSSEYLPVDIIGEYPTNQLITVQGVEVTEKGLLAQ